MRLKARHMRHLHAALTLAWLAVAVPTLLWWKDSIAFIAWVSVYANVAGHWSAWQAARAEEQGSEEATTTDVPHRAAQAAVHRDQEGA